MLTRASRRTPPEGALACAPGSGTLPPFAALTALVVRRVKGGIALLNAPRKWPLGLLYCINGFADQPMPASVSRRATPKGVERALGSGTLPPALYEIAVPALADFTLQSTYFRPA